MISLIYELKEAFVIELGWKDKKEMRGETKKPFCQSKWASLIDERPFPIHETHD